MEIQIEILAVIAPYYRAMLKTHKKLVKAFVEEPAPLTRSVKFTVELVDNNPMTAYKLGREWGKTLSSI